MFSGKNWHRFATLTLIVGSMAIALAGCGKKPDTPKAEETPKPAPGPNPPSTTPPGPTPTPTPPASVDLAKAKPEATYTVQAFLAEMTKDNNFPVSKYAGKVIELNGVVTGYGFGPNAGAFMLETEPNRPLEARPYKATNVSQPWTKALPTQTVTLRTQVAESKVVPSAPWQFIEAKGSPPVAQTAEQLVKERDTDSNAFNKKYRFAWVLVTGSVIEAKASGDGGTEFVLAVGEKGQLLCTIPTPTAAVSPPTPSQIAALKPGTKVKLLGQPTGDRLADCILLEPAP